MNWTATPTKPMLLPLALLTLLVAPNEARSAIYH